MIGIFNCFYQIECLLLLYQIYESYSDKLIEYTNKCCIECMQYFTYGEYLYFHDIDEIPKNCGTGRLRAVGPMDGGFLSYLWWPSCLSQAGPAPSGTRCNDGTVWQGGPPNQCKKTVVMACHPCYTVGRNSEAAYTQRMIGVGSYFRERQREIVWCPGCDFEVAAELLSAHLQVHHSK